MINNLRDLLSSISRSNNSAADEIKRIFGSKRALIDERRAERDERKAERKADKEVRKSERDAVNTDDLTRVDENIDETNGSETSGSESIEELARLYVQQYEDNSGRDLNDDEFEAKVKEVAKFYSDIDNGKERLDDVVFANDEKDKGTDVVA